MKLVDHSLAAFSGLLAADSPTPGGGSTAAVHGAMGASLLVMVAAITALKPEYACRRTELRSIIENAQGIRQRLLALVDGDIAAYRAIMAARALPRKTEAQDDVYRQAMQEALKTAVLTPCEILKEALEGLHLAERIHPQYYPHTASDLGLAAQSLKTAAQGADLTMLINLGAITDVDFRNHYRTAAQTMLDEATRLADGLYADTRNSLAGQS